VNRGNPARRQKGVLKMVKKVIEKNVIEIKSLTAVTTSENTIYNYSGYSFTVWRVKNDINGNPIYRIVLSKDGENLTSELKGNKSIHRAYIKKGFATIQSYSLSNSLENMFNNLISK
jgi:hypothetical protein